MLKDVMLKKRDAKAKPHLEQYAPVWIVDEALIPADEAILFNVLFQHPEYNWVVRRYRFDAFNSVLYHKGQVAISEESAIEMANREPYINVTVSDIPGAYGG
jgi:hypothetical protein